MVSLPHPMPDKPRLRGVSHQWAFLASLLAGALLVAFAPSGRAAGAAAVYALALSGLLGASALYHRGTWTPPVRRWLRRLDHSMIFVLIAGSYTPIALLALEGTLSKVVLIAVWAGAGLGVALKLVWIDAPGWLAALVYVLLGWVVVIALPQLVERVGVVAVALMAVGGLLYTVGAVVYALRRPDPVPTVFGYHEVFHVLVLLAATTHFAVIAGWVLPGS